MPPTQPDTAHLPASPSWLRRWAADHTHAVTWTLATLRTRAACMPGPVNDLLRSYPVDSIVRCDCGTKGCVGYAIVCGVVSVGETPALLLRGSPHADPFVAVGATVVAVHVGGEVTPERYDVLTRGRLGLC